MQICDSCPKPSRCEARDKCFNGNNPAQTVILAKPTPMQVLTTKGYGMTSEPIKKKARKAKS